MLGPGARGGDERLCAGRNARGRRRDRHGPGRRPRPARLPGRAVGLRPVGVVEGDLLLELGRARRRLRVVAEEEVRDLVPLAVLLGEAVPQPRPLGDVVARLVGVAQPDAVGLVLHPAAVTVAVGGRGEPGHELDDGALRVVVDRAAGADDAERGQLHPHRALELLARVLVGRVHELVAEHDRDLVVVHVVQQPGEHVDRVVAHREGVPLLVLDHVDPHVLRVQVGRQQAVDDRPHALDLGAVLVEAADVPLLAAVALDEAAPAGAPPPRPGWWRT